MREPTIIYEEEGYLVINKPAGWTVHGAPGVSGPLVTEWLLNKYPKIKEIGDDPTRPGIVHRLDREASGLMVIAKTEEAWHHFKKLFKTRKVAKTYWALVHGQIAKDEGTLDFAIKRAASGHRMAALPATDGALASKKKLNNRDQGLIRAHSQAKKALTKFTTLKRFINYTLVEVMIKTGRTHQIRVHFFAYGYPLLGDELYQTKKSQVKNQKVNLGRLFLVAKALAFKDLSGQEKFFTLELPPDLQSFLDKTK